jgi:hypothetical protein
VVGRGAAERGRNEGGDPIPYFSSSDLEVPEMTELIEFILAWGAERENDSA